MTDHLTENARLRAALEEALRLIDACINEDVTETTDWEKLSSDISSILATPAPDAVREAARTRLLEKALKVAMGYLAPQQPDDSSAVDDWFLACAAVQAELDDTDGRIEAWLDAAIRARGE